MSWRESSAAGVLLFRGTSHSLWGQLGELRSALSPGPEGKRPTSPEKRSRERRTGFTGADLD